MHSSPCKPTSREAGNVDAAQSGGPIAHKERLAHAILCIVVTTVEASGSLALGTAGQPTEAGGLRTSISDLW